MAVRTMKMPQWQVSVAAEAIAAAQFARLGYKVLVQYGANMPEYDLVVEKGGEPVMVSVKGSQDGNWGLTQSHLKRADYHKALDIWLANHKPKTIVCLVQFKGVPLDGLPRVYVAHPREIVRHMKGCRAGRGNTVLHEHHAWGPRSGANGTIDQIPTGWLLTKARVAELLA